MAGLPRPCLACGALTTNGSRCVECKRKRDAGKEASRDPVRRLLYDAEYRRAAAVVRATATACWICGEGARSRDPFQADHVEDRPGSPLLPAHRSCNIRRAHDRKRAMKAEGGRGG